MKRTFEGPPLLDFNILPCQGLFICNLFCAAILTLSSSLILGGGETDLVTHSLTHSPENRQEASAARNT